MIGQGGSWRSPGTRTFKSFMDVTEGLRQVSVEMTETRRRGGTPGLLAKLQKLFDDLEERRRDLLEKRDGAGASGIS